jgi:glycosyltransferase involved in cell wall biosynthesis
MRIIQINNSDETYTSTASGAIATHIWEVCRAASATGVQTTVLTRAAVEPPMIGGRIFFTESPRPKLTNWTRLAQRVERRIFGWREAGHRRHAHRVAAAISRHGLGREAFMLHNDPELAVVLRQRFPRAKLFHHFHNPVECRRRFSPRFRHAVDGVFAVSSYVADSVRGIYGVESVPVVHNGVDLDRFSPAPNGGGERITLNFLGRTGIEKAPDLFLRAALKLAMEGAPLRVQLVGANHWGRWEADAFQTELGQLCESLRRAGAEVVQKGHVARADIPGTLQAADIHVLPSRWEEPCALSLLEGMAAGLAIVASRTGGTAEILGKAGRLFAKDSEAELHAHLRELVFNSSERLRLGKAARERAMGFSWSEVWRKFGRVIF